MQICYNELVNKIIKWGIKNNDAFPWRNPKSGYESAVAEIMLIRTPPEQVLPVYKRFLKKFPDAKSLNQSSLSEIKDEIKGLGLIWRAKKLKEMAHYIHNKNTGIYPERFDELMKIPGIGEYTASAIITYFYKRRAVMVDSNTVRFFKRFFGVEFSGEARRNKVLKKAMEEITPNSDNIARDFNESFLDFMRKVCLPQNPLCDICILRKNCNKFSK